MESSRRYSNFGNMSTGRYLWKKSILFDRCSHQSFTHCSSGHPSPVYDTGVDVRTREEGPCDYTPGDPSYVLLLPRVTSGPDSTDGVLSRCGVIGPTVSPAVTFDE